MPIHASQLYSKNLLAFLNYVAPQLKITELDFTDEIIKGCLITYHGDIDIHSLYQSLKKG